MLLLYHLSKTPSRSISLSLMRLQSCQLPAHTIRNKLSWPLNLPKPAESTISALCKGLNCQPLASRDHLLLPDGLHAAHKRDRRQTHLDSTCEDRIDPLLSPKIGAKVVNDAVLVAIILIDQRPGSTGYPRHKARSSCCLIFSQCPDVPLLEVCTCALALMCLQWPEDLQIQPDKQFSNPMTMSQILLRDQSLGTTTFQ